MQKDNRVVLGFSGGTDSLVAALMLREQGYEVIGVTLNLCEQGDGDPILDAILLAKKVGIIHFVVDAHDEFEQRVIKPFVNDYMNGLTPSPCSFCNNHIKWEMLKRKADQLGVEKIATGHYVNIEQSDGKYFIHRGVDKVKDQSYFLWSVPQSILKRAITPLGEYTKDKIREIAKENGYEDIATKKESMGVCFLEGKDYISFLKKYHPDLDTKPGEGYIYDKNGGKLGKHKGVPFYTVGQKRWIDVDTKTSLYVKNIDNKNNSLVVATKQELKVKSLKVRDYVFPNIEDVKSPNIETNIRGYGLNPEGNSVIKRITTRRLEVQLEDFAWAVAPGQPVVFYENDRIIGGGIADNE